MTRLPPWTERWQHFTSDVRKQFWGDLAQHARVLRLTPTVSLGAVLVYTGYTLMNVKAVLEPRSFGRSEVLIYAGTLGAIVATNLLTGILVGVGLAIAKLLYTTQDIETAITKHSEQKRTC